jgi:CBS domain-containing protein
MKAADIMSTNIVTIDSWSTIAEAARVMKQHHVRALIVDRTSERDAYGIISATDISQAVANAKNPEATYVCEVMTKPCIVVNPDLAVEHIAKLFTRAKIRIAPVIKDELLGIVSFTDLLTKTDCLTSIKAKLTPQNIEELAELSLDESIETDFDRIYEAWCSG